MNDIINIGEKIRTLRKLNSMTQEQLAEASGLSINFISKLERTNDQNISVNTLGAICNALNIDISEFFFDDSIKNTEVLTPNTQKLLKKILAMDTKKADSFSKSLISLIENLK